MERPSTGAPGAAVTPDGIERLVNAAAGHAADPRAGIFGPGSASWFVNREAAVFLGAGRAALLQLAHPWVARALEEHSAVMQQPIVRFHNTFRIVYTMIFGTLGQAEAAARSLYRLHTRIQGELREDVAGWRRGTHYEANEVAALRWVFATLVESAELAWSCALGPMPRQLREQYYADSKILAGLFGLAAEDLPQDWEAFLAYNRGMHNSDQLGVSEVARRMAHGLLRGAGSWIPVPQWYRALTTDWLPPRIRAEFGLRVSSADHLALVKARRRIPRVYPRLPAVVRFVGPWREAQARLAGHPVGLATRASNRFWIGQTRLPFSERQRRRSGE